MLRQRVSRAATSLLLVLAIGAAGTGFGPPALVDRDANVSLTGRQVALVAQSAAPSTSARAVAILDGATGRLLYGHASDLRLAQASTTKITTAIVVLEHAKPDERVKVDVSASDLPGSSVMGLQPGEELTVEQLLYGLLLPSGNDAALALARHVGGSEEKFVQMMNDKARELGLKNTHYVNPHGLDADDHYSSAADLATLARYASQNPVFNRIVSTQSIEIVGQQTYALHNTNQLLGQNPDVDGVKTGTTDAAGRCVVLSATRGGHRVFVSVMSDEALWEDAQALVDYVFATYSWQQVKLRPSPFYQQPGDDGLLRPMQLTGAPELCVSRWEAENLRWQPLSQSDEVGDASVGSPVAFFFGDLLLGMGSLGMR